MTPFIHLNGTGRDRLIEYRVTVLNHLRDARRAMKAMAPNGRDYYPLGPDAMEAAQQVHLDRLAALDSLIDQIDIETEAIADA